MFDLLIAVAIAATPVANEKLTNEIVLSLASAGVGDEAIIAKIRSSSAEFDTSTSQILALKQKGLSGPVLAAMIEASAPKAVSGSLSIDSSDPLVPHAPGVYLMGESASTGKMMRMDATMSNQAKTGGILGYALTGGIASMSVKVAIQNETARIKADETPEFYFFFDESNASLTSQSSNWLSGTAATVTSPAEFTMVQLVKKKGRREARVGSANIGGVKTGVMDKDRIAFDYTLVRPGVYKVVPLVTLKPGEYGLMYSVTGGNTGGAATARVYDFSVL